MDSVTAWAHGAWEAVAVTLAEPLRKAFQGHLNTHLCGTGDHRSPHYVGGFIHCPTAAELWELLPEGDRVVFGASTGAGP